MYYEYIRYDYTIPNTVYYCSDKNNMTGPIDNTETWATHFSGRLYDDIQDQIDAGYIHYLIPVGTSATYSEEYIALGYPPDAISTIATIEVRTTGNGNGNLTLELWQKNANTLDVYEGPLHYREDLGKYITSGAFTHIKVDYTFNASTYDTYTLETALIIGET